MTLQPISVTQMATALGLTVGASGSQHWISPCPACGAQRRHQHRKDRRGAISVTRDDAGWRCWACGQHGKAAALAYHAGTRIQLRAIPQPRPERALEYLIPDEARRFWTSCLPAHQSASASAWLRARRLGAARCARSLPTGPSASRLPPWARRWVRSGHHLVFGLHDATGRLRNVLARSVTNGKSLAPGGVLRTGLVLADRLGVDLLRGRYTGPLVIVEGEKRLLCAESMSEGRWATLGTGSGLWSDEIAASCARASRVVVYTDPDPSGVSYAQAIIRSLPDCRLRPEFEVSRGNVVLRSGRWEQDDDAWLRAGVVPGFVQEAIGV